MSSLPQVLHAILFMAPPLLVAMILHEFAHGWVANHLGDPTARLEGRLTLNPFSHIDPLGTVILPLMCLLIPGGYFLGWAKPVPINPGHLRNPRRDMALVAAAGPGMNLLLALGGASFYVASLAVDPSLGASWPPELSSAGQRGFFGTAFFIIAAMALYSVFINMLLMAFNLIPIPPLDGGRVLTSLLPVRWAASLAKLEPYGMLIIVLLIVFDPQIRFISTITGSLVTFMAGTIISAISG